MPANDELSVLLRQLFQVDLLLDEIRRPSVDRLEVRAFVDGVALTLTDGYRAPSFATSSVLSLSHDALSPEARAAGGRRLLEHLRNQIERLDRPTEDRFRRDLEDALRAKKAEVPYTGPTPPDPQRFFGADAPRSALGPEEHVLAPFLDAYRAFFRVPIALRWVLGPDRRPVAVSLAFPRLSRHDTFLSAPRKFRDDGRFADAFGCLGFLTDEDYDVRTVPTPRSYRILSRLYGFGASGYRPELHPRRTPFVPARTWYREVLGGRFLLNVGTPAFYRVGRPGLVARIPWAPPVSGFWDGHLHQLAHDLGMHVLLTHRIPARVVRRLGNLARVHGVGRAAAQSYGMFFEEDLTHHARETWAEVDSPAAFGGAFEARLPTLEQALRGRGR
ncbi:MAG: hypothetical protein AAGF12_34115 [Myxococcota bacterium]